MAQGHNREPWGHYGAVEALRGLFRDFTGWVWVITGQLGLFMVLFKLLPNNSKTLQNEQLKNIAERFENIIE